MKTETARASESLYTNWRPRPGWLILLPSREATQKNGIYIPESIAKKSNSGICILAFDNLDNDMFLNQECFFPAHSEYQVQDTDTGWLLYIVEVNKIILTRTPPNDIARFSKEKTAGLSLDQLLK